MNTFESVFKRYNIITLGKSVLKDNSKGEGELLVSSIVKLVPNGCGVINLAESDYFDSIVNAFASKLIVPSSINKYKVITFFMDEFRINSFGYTENDISTKLTLKFFVSPYFDSFSDIPEFNAKNTLSKDIREVQKKFLGSYFYVTNRMLLTTLMFNFWAGIAKTADTFYTPNIIK